MNFDHYLEHNRTDPKRVALLTFAAAVAISGTTLMLGAGWVAGKMAVARVDPPTTEYILLALSAAEALPPPPPPPPPPGGEVEEEEDVEPDEETPPEDLLEQPEDRPTEIPKHKPGVAKQGMIGGIPGGQVGGQIGGIPGGIPAIGLPKTAIATKPSTPEPIAKTPLATVMARAVYAPDPDQKALQMTKAARFDKRSGKSTISFCIDANGHVFNVKVKAKFPGDPGVDAILSKTISSWRFKPLEVGSKKMTTCSERTFALTFK
jgi:protein TonB